MANSVAWSLAAILLLYLCARRVHGEAVALAAALLLAVSPMSLHFAGQLRMYSMITCLAVPAWYFTHSMAAGSRPRLAALLAGLAEVAVIYSQATGVMLVVSTSAYGLLLMRKAPDGRRRFGLWLGSRAITGALAFRPSPTP
ncbi:glycosyltransferase family 39 protein [Arenibaculum pallidiluteum]|uniref:glycosyltransferase family 39 protein n=1 Tax=Arenibaculum pallidiluteum TaxID=2812559 RepID=UPI001A978665|nr:glycosyltransferase family 39 protein [Arenibaculum pallidiluteum]